jgi:signal transduction histidine kinase/CheY-like chemotaxis protein
MEKTEFQMKHEEKRAFTGKFGSIPEKYRARFEEERLETNVGRMMGFAIYIVTLQIVLQVINVLLPQGSGEGMKIPLDFYIILSLLTLFVGIVYWILLALAKRHKIKGHNTKVFLVQSLLYIYGAIQMTFCTFNILSHQGVNGQLILVLLFGLVPILNPLQSSISIFVTFVYTGMLLFFTQNIVDAQGNSAWLKLFETDMRAYFVIVNGLTILISAFIYRLYVSHFLKSVALEESNTNLEATVRKRTKELEEKTFAAQAASDAKSRFLTSMSHEIRTPLNAIMGMAQITKKAASKEKAAASAEQILGASDHLLGILNDILDMSNIESGKLEIEKTRFNFNRILGDTVNIIGQRCAEKGLIWNHNTADLPTLIFSGDKLRLRQVLINLLGNSVKYTPEDGKIDFIIKIENETNSTVTISFVVKDSGIGITQEQQQKLFIAFEQGSINSMKHGGTGLGLAISQSLVKMMGGEIKCESVPNKGSAFSFSITFEKAEASDESVQIKVPDLMGKRILMVEDIEINRIVLCELLAETNAIIEEAFNGEEALEKFKNSSEGYYYFIFMDLLMPKMNGFDTTRNIRSLKRSDAASVPIVALSANAYDIDVASALEAGMNGHLAKPLDFAALMQALIEHAV